MDFLANWVSNKLCNKYRPNGGLISSFSMGMDEMERWMVIRGQQSSKSTFGAKKKKKKIFVLFWGNAGSDSVGDRGLGPSRVDMWTVKEWQRSSRKFPIFWKFFLLKNNGRKWMLQSVPHHARSTNDAIMERTSIFLALCGVEWPGRRERSFDASV